MSEGAGLYEQVLAAGGGRLAPARPPRASAAVVLWRRSASDAGETELFWLERGATLPFMGGWHAFPGGAVERSDRVTELAGEPRGTEPGQRTPASSDAADSPPEPDLAPGLVAAALRELAEETGVRLVADGVPDAARLTFAGRWLTPPFAPVRFDNRFFLADWRASDGEARAVPPESASGGWIRPSDALARIEAGEALVAPPIFHILRVLSELALHVPDDAETLARLRDTSEANLGPMRRIELRRGILLFPLAAATLPPATHTNAYLLGTGDAVLVDPGSADEVENRRLLEALAVAETKLGRRVTAIWLTHHHPDHVGGVERLRRALDVPVLAHPATAERLRRVAVGVDGELHDLQRIELAGGDRGARFAIRVLHTPGHTRGHLAFEIEATRDLVAGDLVAGFGTIVIDPPEGDMTDYLGSLARLRDRNPRTLFVAHGAPFLDAVGKLEEYRMHRLEREAHVLRLFRSGCTEPAAMVPEIYPDVPAAIHPLAERQIRAHLERLAKLGEI